MNQVVELIETVRQLQPSASVQVEADPRGARMAFALVPSAARPRMLVPSDRRCAAEALRRFSSALGRREVVARQLAATAVGLLGPGRVNGSAYVTVHGGEAGIDTYLSEKLKQEVRFSVTIGNARANRKPVLQVFDKRGFALAYAKLGVTNASRQLVEHEATALKSIGSRLHGFEVPRLIGLADWRGIRVLIMGSLRTRPNYAGGRVRLPLAAMASFSLQLGHVVAPLAGVPQWRRLRKLATRADLRTSIEELERLAANLPDLVVGSWHGDWTSWNMCQNGGAVQLWDFERFERGVVHGLDAFHFEVNGETLAHGQSVPIIMRAMTSAAAKLGPGLSPRIVGAVYLLAIAERYLESTSTGFANLIEERAANVVEALRLWVLRTMRGVDG